ncbi:Uncharacterized protein SCF082_LOCUS17337 [Durusdinium trenchii]|uniref:Uncharacterized protein n=1 Tax=Durusdinium trenchii TaxID=1381693 RepID=A0ABP0KH85_9DINO
MKSDICAGSEELSGGPGPHSAHWDDAWVTPRSCGGQALNPNAAPDADGLETVAPTARTQLLPKVEDVELAEDPVEEVKEASAPWGRFMMLWFCCTLASGILPGQALFAKQFADAGVFSSTCNKDEDTCKDQYLALTGIFSVGQSLAYGFSAPIGLLYDRYGAAGDGRGDLGRFDLRRRARHRDGAGGASRTDGGAFKACLAA